jgi:hypothetical protein
MLTVYIISSYNWCYILKVREYRRGNQKWIIQRNCSTKGQSKMDNPEKLATRRGNPKWIIQRNWQHEGEIKNG